MYLRLTGKCEVGAQTAHLGLSGVFQGVSSENFRLSGLGWGLGMSPKGSQSLVQGDSTSGGFCFSTAQLTEHPD